MLEALAELRAVVQRNCDVADAACARNYTMCTYLLKMREYCRWRHGYGATESLPRERVGEFVEQTEARWDALADEPFAPLPIAGARVDPFDAGAVNAALEPHGLVYGAVLGRFGHPSFFLARRLRRDRAR